MAATDRAAANDSRQRRALGSMAAQGLTHSHTDNEPAAGTIDGSNVTYQLGGTPAPGSLMLFKNGLLMSEGADDDYTLSGITVTFNADQVPQTGDKIRAFYRTNG